MIYISTTFNVTLDGKREVSGSKFAAFIFLPQLLSIPQITKLFFPPLIFLIQASVYKNICDIFMTPSSSPFKTFSFSCFNGNYSLKKDERATTKLLDLNGAENFNLMKNSRRRLFCFNIDTWKLPFELSHDLISSSYHLTFNANYFLKSEDSTQEKKE